MTIPLIGRGSPGRKDRPAPDAMTIAQHLSELRRRLIIAVGAYLVAALVAVVFYGWELSILKHPYCQVSPHHCGFYVTAPLDPLSLRVKLAAFGGLVLASPVMLWELWRFITPGLRPNEKRYAVPFVLSAVAFFLGGCAVAYFIFPHALHWLIGVGGPSLHELFNPNGYLTLILLLMFLFGLTFEFPVVLVALQLAHVVSPGALLRAWRWAVIGITVGAAVFTPSSDPISMLALAVPLVAFYFLAIGVGKLLGR
jgi:sec-independent protein translocase protein TatC